MRTFTTPFRLCLLLSATAAMAEGPTNERREGKLPAATLSVEAITRTAKDSIVTITQYGRGGKQEALGTGFVVTRDGLIATNKHVIGNARRIQVELSDGSKHAVEEIYATDSNLDLAIVKIHKNGLTPLILGENKDLTQGQTVIALGNPQGLSYSVVEGVLSAVREIEGATMLQLAIPIEEGNSGGPVLDLQGRVQGVVTLKSAITDNLGFAHCVDDLKLLLNQPNPVPMSRWLTIGKLDTRTWNPLFGATWTQHAGTIHAEGAGQGFGGRTLCLNNKEIPSYPFEATVTVKLEDESGAAGLAFCSDGENRHYGFYPSAGNMRLVRFNGPDLFSWTILHDAPHPAYQSGTWNSLKIRVDQDKIQCYVNNQLVTELPDTELRGGYAGLCKFRAPGASFKSFQMAENLPKTQISTELLAELQTELDSYLAKQSKDTAPSEKMLATPAAARQMLRDRARDLEKQASELRQLEKSIHRTAVTRELITLLQRPTDQTELLRAALLVAKHDNADLDVDAYLTMALQMAADLKSDEAIKQSTASAALRICRYLFQENGFHGTRGDTIENFSNSYLNEVLDDREGIPITLSIVFLEIARQLNLQDIHGANLPGRFMVSFDEKAAEDSAATTYIDVFDNGKILTREEVESRLLQSTGEGFSPEHLKPATPRAIILRLLHNLISYSKTPEQSLPYLDLVLAIDPDSVTERLNRALIRIRQGNINGARNDLDVLRDSQPAGLDMGKLDALYESL